MSIKDSDLKERQDYLSKKKSELFQKYFKCIQTICNLQIILLTATPEDRPEINKQIKSLGKQARNAITEARITRGRLKSLLRTTKNIKKARAKIKQTEQDLQDEIFDLKMQSLEILSEQNRRFATKTKFATSKLSLLKEEPVEQASYLETSFGGIH